MAHAQVRDGDTTFHCRVAVLAIDSDRLLLHQMFDDTYWSLPGGRLEIGETFADTAVREMREETGFDVAVIEIRWVVENFFSGRLPGETAGEFHEVGAYVQVSVPPELAAKREFTGHERHGEIQHDLRFRWFPMSEIRSIDLRPVVVKDLLPRLGEGQLIVSNEELRG